MKYLLLIYLGEQVLNERIGSTVTWSQRSWRTSSRRNGQFLATAPLQPVSTATTVRVRDGKRMVTDGPFAETREQLGGFFLVDARNLDEAISIASGFQGRESAL